MIRKLKEEETQASTPASTPASESQTTLSESLEKLEFDNDNTSASNGTTTSSAMATALRSADCGGTACSSDGTGDSPRSPGSPGGSRRGLKDKLFHRRKGSRPSSSSGDQVDVDRDKDKDKEKEKEKQEHGDHLVRWIREGNVICKFSRINCLPPLSCFRSTFLCL